MRARGGAVASDPLQLDFFTFTAPTAKRAEPVLAATPPVPKALAALVLPPIPDVPYQTKVGTVGRNLRCYRITDEDGLGNGSLRLKARANLVALETLKNLEAAGRAATENEKRCLVRYVGWGGLPQVFDERNQEWAEEGAKLRRLLTEPEYESARATTLNAHYSPSTVIRAVYQALGRLGFQEGRILEPACGLGHFFGLMPEPMLRHSQLTGIEIDSVTARLTRMLYPDADIRHSPFEEARLAEDFYDVAISNVPFGDYQPFDRRFQSWDLRIHDYFFAAALTNVRPGGLVLFITSRGTLDKADETVRRLLSSKADFLGAIRLPNDTFKQNANTEVTTDLVILRKRLTGEPLAGQPWLSLEMIPNSLGEKIAVNEYYAAHPEMMLGEMRLAGRMYRNSEPTLVHTGGDVGEALRTAIERLPQGVYEPAGERQAKPGPEPSHFSPPAEIKPNAYAVMGGELLQRDGHVMRQVTGLPARTASRLQGLVRVRDAVRCCLRAQWEDKPEEEIESARLFLNQTYDQFVGRFGCLSERGNISAFRADPDLPLLLSLEHFDRETGQATKAAIFRERTVAPSRMPAMVSDARSALLQTLNVRGCVDLKHLAGLLLQSPDEFLPELKGVIFLNPQSQRYETDDEYLSGNVRTKLSAAEAAALVDPRFRDNVDALRAVQPAELGAAEIDPRLGCTWLPPPDVERFAEELL
ncbi:MAG TPA: DNA helicase, partial [Verrucomicrobiota bacterium]|nr:DNA helicase [Verrucomicrobiota bacterium]